MKEQYIRQVKKELGLCLSREKRSEIIRDLNEIFGSALEHGETEQQVIERLGAPRDFVENTMEQFGAGRAALKRQRGILSGAISLFVALAAFSVLAAAQSENMPENAIGAADAMTTIRVEGAWGIDLAKIILAIGVIAAVIAVIQMIRAVYNGRR